MRKLKFKRILLLSIVVFLFENGLFFVITSSLKDGDLKTH